MEDVTLSLEQFLRLSAFGFTCGSIIALVRRAVFSSARYVTSYVTCRAS